MQCVVKCVRGRGTVLEEGRRYVVRSFFKRSGFEVPMLNLEGEPETQAWTIDRFKLVVRVPMRRSRLG